MQAMDCKYSVSDSTGEPSSYQSPSSKANDELMTQTAEIEEFLRPAQFNWADESEELESALEGEMEEAVASFYELERQPSFSSGEPENEGSEATTSIEVQEADGTTAGLLIVIGTVEEQWCKLPEPDDQEDETRASMKVDVSREFAYRQVWVDTDSDGLIHHFNWMGCATYEYSATPAAISLLALLANPKIPASLCDEWRYQSIMQRAMQCVDPVLVYLETGWGDLLKRGSDLVQWATGRVHKFYTPHGSWQNDSSDMEDGTLADNGDVDNYMGRGIAFSNGYIELCTPSSRSQWQKSHQQLWQYTYDKRSTPSRTGPTPYKPSPLRQCMVLADFEDETVAGKFSISTLGCMSCSRINRT